jgi:hypothetical protein
MAFAFPAFCFALISGGRFKSFDDGFGLRRSGGLGFSQSGSFFRLAQTKRQPTEKLLFDDLD